MRSAKSAEWRSEAEPEAASFATRFVGQPISRECGVRLRYGLAQDLQDHDNRTTLANLE